MKEYMKPEVELVVFSTESIATGSGDVSGDGGGSAPVD